MKKQILMMAAIGTFHFSNAQDIPQHQVPSVILNQFNTQFPKATDIEWELDGSLYSVEFETGWSIDHTLWYGDDGKMVKHKEDIPTNELPQRVKDKIKGDFKGYTIDDIERITDHGTIVYRIELNSLMHQDWDVVVDSEGTILAKMAD
ncbi:PepSY-like domain-containing protein [Flagellimonas sp.]|uniref:PepSY-like domain-containing protein n=1 Tax=Flagellimonas sp. TaxID=2058762 RepID=UPI003AB2A745